MDELIAIKDRAWEAFSTLPGVHAVGIGNKVVGGRRTDEIVLTVFVTQKLPLDQLSADAAVPPVFEGVRTDVVQMPMPRTFADPITVTDQVIPNGKSFTFTSTPDPPPLGVRMVLTMTYHSPGHPDFVVVLNVDSDGETTVGGLLNRFAIPLTGPLFNPAVTGNTLAITVVNTATDSLDASCYILVADAKPYAQEYLRGGVRIQGGSKEGAGTLGCLATLAPTADYPQGRVVGITCAHVVRDIKAAPAMLNASTTGNTIIDLGIPTNLGSIPAHNVIYLVFIRNNVVQASTFYTTRENESLGDIAAGLVAAIKATGLPGVTASLDAVAASTAQILIGGFSAANESIDCRVHGATLFQGDAPLQADLEKVASGDYTVIFRGSVDTADIGVFVDIDPGGVLATFGIFHNPSKKQGLADLAQAISTAINLWPSAQRGLVSATAVGPKLTIAAARDVRVRVQLDLRVGQPINFFGTTHPRCCNFRIGRVLAARQDLDVALVQIDPGTKYKHHIQEMNAVAGTQPPTPGLAVQKRGAFSGVTEGMVSAVATSGFISSSSTLARIYHNVTIVDSTILDTPLTRRAFAGPGDSGAAVLTRGLGVPKVVGILFGGAPAATALMTPIDDVVSGFSKLGLSFDPGIGVDLSAVHTVPAAAVHFQALDADDSRAVNGSLIGSSLSVLDDRLREAERELSASPAGRLYAALVRLHFAEAVGLINENRRVATVWHRSGGPELLNAVLRVMRFDDEPLPSVVNGRPIAECIARLNSIFLRYASPQFASDIARLAGQFRDLSGLTYPQVLNTLRAGGK